MKTIVPALSVGSLVFGVILYLNAFQPKLVADGARSLGLFAPVADERDQQAQQAERRRLEMIDALLISAKNKTDLRNGQPYWGAAPHMIALAMRKQPDGSLAKMQDGVLYEFQNFFFADIRGQLTYEFHNNRLTCLHYLSEQRSACQKSQTSLYGSAGFPYAGTLAQYHASQQ